MSWLRTAVSKAVEVGEYYTLTRTVRDYAGTVVTNAGYAVSEGARFLQGDRSLQSFKQTAKRLEEVSVSCNGDERVQLLRRWLVALKEIERISAYTEDNEDKSDSYETKDLHERPILVYYYDPDLGGEPRNFRDVFLHSQALEGITLSMVSYREVRLGIHAIVKDGLTLLLIQILKAPSDEEVLLLIELYKLCLHGGDEVQNRVAEYIQSLAKAFMGYHEEVLVKREELLQYVQDAITGLKINSNFVRIDAETISLKEKLNKSNCPKKIPSDVHKRSSNESGLASKEELEEEHAQVQLCVMMESLLIRKKAMKDRETPEVHEGKVDKLKVLSESLVNSSSKAEKRIDDHRLQKEEALNFRMTKTNEINQAEKELEAEIAELEKQKDELEAALKKVNSSLATAHQRLQYAKEEIEQFDEASDQVLIHYKLKEDELSRSILSCSVEADIVNTWISFLEDTWTLQTSCLQQSNKQVSGELKKLGEYFVNLAVQLLSIYEQGLRTSTLSIRKVINELDSFPRSGAAFSSNNDNIEGKRPRIKIEEEFLELEAKIVATLSIVETMKQQFYISSEAVFRKNQEKVEELFDAIEKMQAEFKSIERPFLEVENLTKVQTPPHEGKADEIPISREATADVNPDKNKKPKKESSNAKGNPQMDAQLTRLMKELGESDGEYSPKDIAEWEFDELEKDSFPLSVTTDYPTTPVAAIAVEPEKTDRVSE